MTYVAAIPHQASRAMLRTTFLCSTCNQIRSYMLSAALAGVYMGTGDAVAAPEQTDAAVGAAHV